MSSYLSTYYSMLVDVTEVYNSTHDKNIMELIDNYLNIGRTKEDRYYFEMYTPLVMNNMNKVYQGVKDFYDLLFSKARQVDAQENELYGKTLFMMYKSILIAKTQRIFRWYSLDEEGNLIHTTLPPRPYSNDDFNLPRFISRPLSEYNSYEGIGELRIIDKIIYNIEDRIHSAKDAQDGQDVSLYVAVIGDIGKGIYELRRYLIDCLGSNKEIGKKVTVNIDAYTKNEVGEEQYIENPEDNKDSDKTEVNVKINKYDSIFEDSNNIYKMIKGHDLVFFLDCIDLYHDPVIDTSTPADTIITRYKENPYDRYDIWMDTPENIFVKNPLDDLYENLVALRSFNYMGNIRKRANDTLIRFCENVINDREGDKIIYIYMSDLNCFNSLYCIDKTYVRVEQYNDKQIGIIQLSKKKADEKNGIAGSLLKVDDNKEKIITFNLWQLVKHIALEDRNDITEIFVNRLGLKLKDKEKEKWYINFRNFIFGIDYSDWRNGLTIHYNYIPFLEKAVSAEHYNVMKEKLDRISGEFIQEVLKVVLQREQGSMYRQYCKNVVNSFLYGNAKSVEDMLFLHLLKRQYVNLDRIEKGELNKEMGHKNGYNIFWADKRVYDTILPKYDSEIMSIAGQNIVADMVASNGVDKNTILDNIKAVCGELSYKNSPLYKRCLYERNEEE